MDTSYFEYKTWSGKIKFSILAHNQQRGWQNFEILSPSEPIVRVIIENMILPDHV